MDEVNHFKNVIESSNKILITSHISPDPDAICSVLLLGTTLKLNYPDKQIVMVLEEEPARALSFLGNYGEIKFAKLLDTAREFKPDMFVMVDAMNFSRISRSDGDELGGLVNDIGSQVAIIDHHTEAGLEKSDIYINETLPATVQQIYTVLFSHLGLKKPEGFAQTTLLGIISDTARFKYENHRHRDTFAIISDLLDAGASIESLENQLDRYSAAQMKVLSNLAKNISDSGKGYTYTFIDDAVTADTDEDKEGVIMAGDLFSNQFLRNFESNQWGFVIYPEVIQGEKTYSVSFRAVNGVKDVAAIAAKLGGGGHKSAAGAKGIMASDAFSAVRFVETVIEDNK